MGLEPPGVPMVYSRRCSSPPGPELRRTSFSTPVSRHVAESLRREHVCHDRRSPRVSRKLFEEFEACSWHPAGSWATPTKRAQMERPDVDRGLWPQTGLRCSAKSCSPQSGQSSCSLDRLGEQLQRLSAKLSDLSSAIDTSTKSDTCGSGPTAGLSREASPVGQKGRCVGLKGHKCNVEPSAAMSRKLCSSYAAAKNCNPVNFDRLGAKPNGRLRSDADGAHDSSKHSIGEPSTATERLDKILEKMQRFSASKSFLRSVSPSSASPLEKLKATTHHCAGGIASATHSVHRAQKKARQSKSQLRCSATRADFASKAASLRKKYRGMGVFPSCSSSSRSPSPLASPPRSHRSFARKSTTPLFGQHKRTWDWPRTSSFHGRLRTLPWGSHPSSPSSPSSPGRISPVHTFSKERHIQRMQELKAKLQSLSSHAAKDRLKSRTQRGGALRTAGVKHTQTACRNMRLRHTKGVIGRPDM
eukprot:evm.model.scf_392.7 EVM.evm.TU.scf_392.7   scf_392:32827-34996(+)